MKFKNRLVLLVSLVMMGAISLSCGGKDFTSDPSDSDSTAGPNIPLNSWLTQLGATTKAFTGADNTLYDRCEGVAVDEDGNAYCAGQTNGAIGETLGGGIDAFVMKVSPEGAILWLRQLGADTQAASTHVNSTIGNDYCYSVAVDGDGNVYCSGQTTGALAETNGGSADAFVMKLSSQGEVLWIKQLGATTQAASAHVNSTAGMDRCEEVAVDGAGNVYCSGFTVGALAETNGGQSDAFVMKLNSAGDIVWIKQLGLTTETASAHVDGTFGNDYCRGVAVDGSGNVYCAGDTSGDLAEFRSGASDAFVMKLNSSGDIVWIRQLGADTELASAHLNDATLADSCNDVAVDLAGNVYCAGATRGALSETNGGWDDAFILKLNSAGDITWIKQLGATTQAASSHINDTAGFDRCEGVAVDLEGNVYCGGETSLSLGETVGTGGSDSFLMKLNSSGDVQWLRHLGAVTIPSVNYQSARCYEVAVDLVGGVYCAGVSVGELSEPNGGGGGDTYIVKLKSDGSLNL